MRSYSTAGYSGKKCSQTPSVCRQRSGARNCRCGILAAMSTKLRIWIVGSIVACSLLASNQTTIAPVNVPQYTSDGQLKMPENYREWVYLSTGIDMSYSPAAQTGMDHHMFDNVFANPEAYATFKRTGTWPDKTML